MTQVEHSAGGVVVRPIGGVLHVLLIRDPYRKWGLPKGHLEDGEGPMDAALREVQEETGLDSLIPGPDLGQIDWVFRTRGGRVHKYCRFYLMGSLDGEVTPQREEGIFEVQWMPLDEALRRVAYDNARAMIHRARRHLPWAALG
jgi:8-oxo-dGTP pyrophosphatase MutT (NUDIX family)